MSVLTSSLLDRLPVESVAARVYLRHCYIPAAGNPDPLWVDAVAESRWRTPDGTLYVAEEIDTVMAEYCRNNPTLVERADPTGGVGLNPLNFAFYAPRPVGDPLPARAVFSVEVAFRRVADFRAGRARAALGDIGISPDDLVADDYGPCPRLAELGETLGWEAVRAQSAAETEGTAVAIFRASHPAKSLWRVEYEAVRPSVRIAYLTRYRAGERPTWLNR